MLNLCKCLYHAHPTKIHGAALGRGASVFHGRCNNPLLLTPFAAPTPSTDPPDPQVRFCYCKEDAKLQAACANLRSYLGQGGKGAPQ